MWATPLTVHPFIISFIKHLIKQTPDLRKLSSCCSLKITTQTPALLKLPNPVTREHGGLVTHLCPKRFASPVLKGILSAQLMGSSEMSLIAERRALKTVLRSAAARPWAVSPYAQCGLWSFWARLPPDQGRKLKTCIWGLAGNISHGRGQLYKSKLRVRQLAWP